VTFYALPNAGGDRSTTVTFKTYSGKKEYTSQTTISQKGAIVACTAAEFLAAPVGDTQYRLTGVITKVAKAEYGNIYVKDYSGEVYVYGVGAKGDFEKLGLKEGDIVTLVGKRAAYKDSPQMGGGQYESHISVTEVSLADFLSKPDDKNVYYKVTGTVKDLLSDKGAENDYGNLHLTDGTNELYVYGCYPGYGATGDARKGFIKAAGIKAGDKLTMIGYKSTYNGLIELCGGIYFSHIPANE
jgi:RPA family protein